MKIFTQEQFPRRAFLRSASGAALALPLLSARRTLAADAPKRFVVYHVPEGVPVNDGDIFANTPDHWWPTNNNLATLPKATAPLGKYKDKLLFCKGFGFVDAGGADRHVQGMQDMLTGNLTNAPDRMVAGVNVRGGMSIDQILGQHLGQTTPFKSYGLGILNFREGVQEKRRISFGGPTAGRDPQNDPLAAFTDLLSKLDPNSGAGVARQKQLMLRKGILSDVKASLDAIRCEYGADGKRKVEAYLQSIAEIQQGLAQELSQSGSGSGPKVEKPTKEGEPGYWRERNNAPGIGDIQMKIAAAALAADSTRVITFQWNQSVSQQVYPWLDVSDKTKEGHGFAHSVALDPGQAARWANDRAIIFEWYTQQFVKFLDMLAAVPEGNGTLLDNTAVLYCSEMSNGHHRGSNLPFLLVGSAGGAFKTGRVLDAKSSGIAVRGNGRVHNDLLTGIVQGYGLPLPQIGRAGDNGKPYADILA